MIEITTSGKTVDQAIEKALYELGTTRDQVEVKVLDIGSDGILGVLGFRRAKVRVTIRQEAKVRATHFLEGLIQRMGLETAVTARETSDALWLEIQSDGDGGLLIGHRGQTLQALQLLTERALADDDAQQRRIVVDVNRYLRDREERLVERARAMADKAVAEGRVLRMEPLPDVERRIVHHALRSDRRVLTRSVGRGPMKPVVVAPKPPGGASGDQGIKSEPRGRTGSGRRAPRMRARRRGKPKQSRGRTGTRSSKG